MEERWRKKQEAETRNLMTISAQYSHEIFPKGFVQFHEDINKGIVSNKSNRIVKIRGGGTFKLVQIFSAVFRVFGNASVLSPYINNERQSTNIIHDTIDMTL
jgi:hypothetical protein